MTILTNISAALFRDNLPQIRCADTAICAAVALTELPAALVSFQRHQPSQPPCKSVYSADCSRIPTCHFGG